MPYKRGKEHPQYKHGHAIRNQRSKEWRAWNAMIRRCTYPSMDDWPKYGGAGVTVCEKWRNSFTAFLEDVGFAPSTKHSIDRIDNNGNYEPGNVRWATPSEQIKNSKRARWIEHQGVAKTIGDWATHLGINRQTLQMRLDHYGWSVEKTLSTPVKERS